MKTFRTALLSIAALFAVVATDAADARGGHHGRSRVGVGVFIGAPLYPYYYPRYYPRYYAPAYYPGPYAYYPPTVTVPEPVGPPVYIEQNPPAAAPPAPSQAAGAYWYFCRDSQTYYPYVQQCASPWQQVVPQTGPAPSVPGGPQSGPTAPQYEPQAGPYRPPPPSDLETAPRS